MIRWLGLIALSLALTGCWFRKKPAVVPPAPVPTSTKPAPEPTIIEPPKPEEIPPPQPPVVETPKSIEKPSPAPPPAKKPAAAKPQRAPARSSPTQGSPPDSPTPSMPQLSEILSPETRKRYETEYSGHVARAQQVLARADGRRLTGAQLETVNRIRTFLRQGEEQHGRDLATALQLARRADLLGQDLVKTLP